MYRIPGQITDRLLADPTLTLDGWYPDREAALRTECRPAAAGYRIGRRPATLTRLLADARHVCHTDPLGRVFAAVVWIGALIATSGLAQLTAELRRNGPHLSALDVTR
jgi:hypothetical protein